MSLSLLNFPESSKGERRDLMGKLLDSDDVKKSLDFSEATVQIDSLYSQILSEAFSGFSREHIQARLQILHTILCAEERISTSIAAALLPNSQNVEDMQERAHSLVQKLHAVLYIKDKSRSSNVALMATGNFRSKDIDMSCDIAYYHSVLTQKCFDIMMKDLKFDMCKFPSSFLKDSEVADLGVMEKVSGVLRYSCYHWAQHMMEAAPKNHKEICKWISEFLNIHVLFWIETMNLLQVSNQCTEILQKTRHYITKHNDCDHSELAKDIIEAANFATHFTRSQAALSTPHLYLSALATWLQNGTLSQRWKKQFSNIPSIRGKSNHSIQLISGSWDKSVRVWDASTGAQVQQFNGHTQSVSSVAFSPDGSQIISGSYDKSVRVWDASTGAQMQQFNGHTEEVTSVAFSPDGSQIISASHDKSVRVWDASTGAQVQQFNGHTQSVSSVAFSLDGSQIISGSSDKSVRLWDASTGAQMQQFNGHTEEVTSVAFLPDGSQIASASRSGS
ncbi:hypothetical protein C0991_006415, partial [Blastosporella zonata]